MLILGLDFETTGFDFQTDRITEVGAVLWDTVTATPVRLVSTLVKHDDAPPISAEITRLTGIDQALLDAHGRPPRDVFAELLTMTNVT